MLQDEFCTHEVNYTVLLNSSEAVIQRDVGSESCVDGICSTSLFPSPSNRTYEVLVSASNNDLGSSDTAVFANTICKSVSQLQWSFLSLWFIIIDGSSESLFSHTITFEECISTAHCSSTLPDMNNCTIEYGRDPSYHDLGPPTTGSLNSSFNLPPMESSTQYFIQITFILNSEPVVLQRNYLTGQGMLMPLPYKPWTDQNIRSLSYEAIMQDNEQIGY